MSVESKANQKLWYADGFKFLNKISEIGHEVVYLAIWSMSLLETVVTHDVVNHVRLSRGSVRKQTGPLRVLSTTHMYAMPI